MNPVKDNIDEFKKIYFEEFKESLSDQEAFERFSRLVNVLRTLILPDQLPLIDVRDGYAKVRTPNT